jgi:HEAT repeat protein
MGSLRDKADRLGGEPDEVAKQLETGDTNSRGLALEELLKRGKRAVPALLKVLDSDDDDARALAAEGLVKLADPSSADRLAKALDDDDERVRSQAATALAQMDDPRGLDALVRTINDNPDVLHAFLSQSGYALIQQGAKALPAVVPLLKADDAMTRERAVWVIRMIASQMENAEGYPQLQTALSGYQSDAAPAERNKSAKAIADWVAKHKAT